MTAEVIPLRRGHAKADGWRHEVERPDRLGTIESFLERFSVHLRALPASEATVYRYTLAARQLAQFLVDPDVAQIGHNDIKAFVVHRMEKTTGSTVNGTFVSLQQFFKFVALEVAPDPFTDPTAGVTPPKFESPATPVIPDEFLADLLKQTAKDRTYDGLRDHAVLMMFVDTGARLAELTTLTLHDLAGDRIRVTGKSKGRGPVSRTVCLSEKTQAALKRYLRARLHHPQARRDALWLGRKGPMSTSGIRQMLWRRSLTLGTRIHPHQFRHTFAHAWKSDPLRHDGDLMEIMGWRTETMLHRYGKSAARERALNAHRDFLDRR